MNLWLTVRLPKMPSPLEGERLYALIDAAQVDRFTDRASGLRGVQRHEPVYSTPLARDRADATPHVLELRDLDAYQGLVRGDFGDALSFPGALALLISPLDIVPMATRLRARLDAQLPDRFECVNRYYDARITPHLHAVLHESHRAKFFSVCSQWWVVGHTHQWQSLPCAYMASDPFVAPLVLDEVQQARMIDACYPYTVIEHFAQTDEELLETVPASQRYGFFRQALAAAARFGIDGGASAILFCTLALTRGPVFYTLAEWQSSLERVKRGELTLQQAVKAQHD